MNSKEILDKVDFEKFINSGCYDSVTRKVLLMSKVANGFFPFPENVKSYSDQDKYSMIKLIEFRERNLRSQGQTLNGADFCIRALVSSGEKDERAWVAIKVDGYILIFIINSKSFEVDGCMSLKVTA